MFPLLSHGQLYSKLILAINKSQCKFNGISIAKMDRCGFIFGVLLIFATSCEKTTPSEKYEAPDFHIIKSSQSGLDFNPKGKATKLNDNSIKEFGVGVSVCNLNNDKLPDLIFSSFYGGVEVYMNQNDFQFKNVSAQMGLNLPDCFNSYGVSIVDINHDGFDDLYISNNNGCGSNRFYINQKGESFKEISEELGLNIQEASYISGFFDFDNDTDLDLFMLNWSNFDSNPIDIRYYGIAKENKDSMHSKFYENINGKFYEATQKFGFEEYAATNNAMIASDINQDGNLDLFISNDFVFPDQLYINNNGVFENKASSYFTKTSFFSMGTDCADINNDFFPDLFVADMLSKGHYRKKTNTMEFSIEFHNQLEEQIFPQYQRNMLHLNNQGKNFHDIAYLANLEATEWSWSPLIFDFNNDGLKDIFITAGTEKELTNLDYISNYASSSGIYNPIEQWVLDWSLIPEHKYHNYLFQNQNGLEFTEVTKKSKIHETEGAEGAAYADLNNDGTLDVVVANKNGEPTILKNNTDTSINKFIQIKLKSKLPTIGAKVCIFHNGHQQYLENITLKGFLSMSEELIHFGLAGDSLVDSILVFWPSGGKSVVQSVKANQQITISDEFKVNENWISVESLFPHKTTNNLISEANLFEEVLRHKEDHYEDFSIDKTLYRRRSLSGPVIKFQDLNNDGLEDVFFGGSAYQNSFIYLQTLANKFELLTSIEKDKNREDISVDFTDIDNNGFTDILVGSWNTSKSDEKPFSNFNIYLNINGVGFEKLDFPHNISSYVSTIAVNSTAKKPTIFIGCKSSNEDYGMLVDSYILTIEGIGSEDFNYTLDTIYKPGIITSSCYQDLNGDGNNELCITGEFMPIKFYEFDDSGHRNSFEISESHGMWNCIELVDLNNDGLVDVLAGNQGKNSILEASPKRPVSLMYNDFDNNGKTETLLFHYLDEICAPLDGKDIFCKQMPSFLQKYPTYDIYARRTSLDIFEDSILLKSEISDATNLKTSVFINKGNKNFEEMLVPVELQKGPVKDILIHDFNNDGYLDFLPFGNDNTFFYTESKTDALLPYLYLNNSGESFSVGQPVIDHVYFVNSVDISNENIIVLGVNNDTVKTYFLK